MKKRLGREHSALLLLIATWLTGLSSTARDTNGSPDLTELPIERLMQIEVTSVARRSETISQSPAAISVVTQEDIRRSGAMNIPDALRLVPGLEVARLDASQWAISARGFNDVFADKLLVLQDGRSIYTPLFSGVFWDVQGPMLEDVDRIEVIRGPGATLWGANAVNGVINIITKSSKDTQGLLLSAGGGNENRAFSNVRYGGKINDTAFFRVYATYFNEDDSALPNGRDANDSWQMGHWGFRLDWDLSDQDLVTFQGDAYHGIENQVFNTFDPTSLPTLSRIVHDEINLDGGNVLGRWSHTLSSESDLRLQLYYDRTDRDTVIFKEKRDTFDADFQHRFPVGNRNDFIWGAGYRVSRDDVGNSPTISLIPGSRTLELFSAFVQDEITLVPNRLRLTLGSKFEHNDFTGFEIQPSGRLLWTPSDDQSVWASVSRAVRTPSRSEDDVVLNQPREVAPGLFLPITIRGNQDMESEKLLAYEIGYRSQPWEQLSFDLAAFYNDYDQLRSLEQDPSSPTVLHPGNKLYGEAYGVELSGLWQIARWWRVRPAYTFLEVQLHTRPGSTDTTSQQDEGKSPRHQFTLRSSMDLPHNLFLDGTLRYVDSLPALKIGSYVELDVRLGWRPTSHLELAIGGQNLLNSQHAEFSPSFIRTQQTEVERGVYGKITWRF